MSYTPHPVDCSQVILPPDILALTEQLAENAHEHWAAERLAQGWKYGPQRDDSRKLHPCLLPYSQLPDAEREFDRLTAINTLKALIAMGYRIEKPVSSSDPLAGTKA
jgi:ryanodine receptor 2